MYMPEYFQTILFGKWITHEKKSFIVIVRNLEALEDYYISRYTPTT